MVRQANDSAAELLSPAGDFDTALAAFAAGADAVYCGLGDFSARAFAKNLSMDELSRLVSVAHSTGKKVYVTFNTVVEDRELDSAADMLARLEEIGPDALIVQDLGVARMCRRHFPSLALHASTQLVAHNLEGVVALSEIGFSRVVLARELSLAEIADIAKRCGKTELECFIHGALCYSVSGLCLFSAMEKGRSGNRGKCAYCCRLAHDDGHGGKTYPFSMRDLRLGEDARRLAEAGVASLKIEGRMKSALYVASVTAHYRAILDGRRPPEGATLADLETVFSRRTTKLYFDGRDDEVIDPSSLGHVGTPIGVVKRVTKDRDGRSWLRFHTARALEKHDGLQLAAPGGGKPVGFGISEMRQAISRANVFEVSAGTDVEVLLPDSMLDANGEAASALGEGSSVYCSMSNSVKRHFPVPSYRPSDYPGAIALAAKLTVSAGRLALSASAAGAEVSIEREGVFEKAKTPGKTAEAARRAFAKLGDSQYRLGDFSVSDPDGLFVPISELNELRRETVKALDAERGRVRGERARAAVQDLPEIADVTRGGCRRVKLCAGRRVPAGEWDEVVVLMPDDLSPDMPLPEGARVALPVYTAEPRFGVLRNAVKRLLRRGVGKFEASDLATLHMLRQLGVEDVTADWTLYAFNASALALLSKLGARRFVASPENSAANLRDLAESGYDVEFLAQQSTPLFISLTEPEPQSELATFVRGGLWVTTKRVPRTFDVPPGASARIDLSWDPQ